MLDDDDIIRDFRRARSGRRSHYQTLDYYDGTPMNSENELDFWMCAHCGATMEDDELDCLNCWAKRP